MIENVEIASNDKLKKQKSDKEGTHAVTSNKAIPVDLTPSQREHKLFAMIEKCF